MTLHVFGARSVDIHFWKRIDILLIVNYIIYTQQCLQ